MTGFVPREIEALIGNDRFLDAAIELGREVVGSDSFEGWRVTFTSAGGPYEARLFRRGGRPAHAVVGRSALALSAAFTAAVRQCRSVEALRP